MGRCPGEWCDDGNTDYGDTCPGDCSHFGVVEVLVEANFSSYPGTIHGIAAPANATASVLLAAPSQWVNDGTGTACTSNSNAPNLTVRFGDKPWTRGDLMGLVRG